MKWLASLLLLLNLAVFLWGFQANKGEQKNQATIFTAVESLTLLSELKQRPEIVPKQTIEQPLEKASENQPNTAATNDEDKLVLDKKESDDLPKAIEVASVEVSAESEVLPAEAKEPVADIDEVVSGGEEQPVPETVPDEPAPADTEMSQQPTCYQIGSITSLDERDEIVARLASIDLLAVEHEQKEQQVVGYWVLIPQQETRDQAIEMVKRLEQAGISDVRRFVKGEFKNAISLGLFKNKAFADGRTQHLIELGFETEIRPRIKDVVSYTLSIKVEDSAILQQNGWQSFYDDYIDAGLTATECHNLMP